MQVAKMFRDEATIKELAVFGLSQVPSCYQLYRTNTRLEEAVSSGSFKAIETDVLLLGELIAEEDEALRRALLHDLLCSGSAPEITDAVEGLWSVDTTYLDAYCRPISRQSYDEGARASDADASGRIIERPGAAPKKHFGYRLTSASRAQGEHEYIDAFRVDTASSHDRPSALEIAEDLIARGKDLKYLAIDRGFNSADLFAELRKLGVEPVFDLDKGEDRYEGLYRGLVILGGWLYSPAILGRPELLNIGPKPVGDDTALERWCRLHDERQRYAWRYPCWLGPGRIQLRPPAGVGCKHPTMRAQYRRRDKSLKTCDGKHTADEACCLTTMVWRAENAPMTWQIFPYGSKKWRKMYKLRSSVERNYSLLKNSDVIDLSRKRIRMRGIGKFSLVVALGAVAINLHLANVETLSDRRVSSLPPPVPDLSTAA